MEMRGYIFTFDAILAATIVMLLFSGMLLVSANRSESAKEALLYMKSFDSGISEFLTGGGTIETAPSGETNCREFFEYDKILNSKEVKVRVCEE